MPHKARFNRLCFAGVQVGKGAPKPAPWGAANDNGAWAKCALLSGEVLLGPGGGALNLCIYSPGDCDLFYVKQFSP